MLMFFTKIKALVERNASFVLCSVGVERKVSWVGVTGLESEIAVLSESIPSGLAIRKLLA